jgi:hypothetical protein
MVQIQRDISRLKLRELTNVCILPSTESEDEPLELQDINNDKANDVMVAQDIENGGTDDKKTNLLEKRLIGVATMDKLKFETKSGAERNIDHLQELAELFPEVITESRCKAGNLIRAVNFDKLKPKFPLLCAGRWQCKI